MPGNYINRGENKRQQLISQEFNIDNGAGTTVDELLYYATQKITIVSATVVYTEATDSAGAASGNVKIGTAAAGTQIVAATALGVAKAVSSITELTLVAPNVPAGGVVWVRHTGVAATDAGKYRVMIDYYVDP